MKQLIKACLSKIGIKPRRYIDCCFERDANIFFENSGLQGDSLAVIAAKMRILSHTIEKALSLSDCRADFGKEKVMELLQLYQSYQQSSGTDGNALAIVEATLAAYAAHRKSFGLDIDFLPQNILTTSSKATDVVCGAMPFRSTMSDFATFKDIAYARHSIRNWSVKEVATEDINHAIELAQTAPSACNRQATKVYAVLDKNKINQIKQRHGGIRSCGMPGVLFVITQDLNLYINEYERNTWLVDGGIFCMNLLYALNSTGIVNCPIIWGGMDDEDVFLKNLLGIPSNERIVVLVVGGYVAEEGVKAPCSAKRPLNDVLRIIR